MKRFILKNINIIENLISKLREVNFDSGQPIYEVIVKEFKSTRSLCQNRLYWKWLHEISKQYHESGRELYSDEVWHEYMKKTFLSTDISEVRGKFIEMRKTTTKLNTKEFTQYLEDIEHYCGSELHVNLPHPEDLYYKAMGYGRN